MAQRVGSDTAKTGGDMRRAGADREEPCRDRDPELAGGAVSGDDRPSHVSSFKPAQPLPSGRVALHAAGIGGGAPPPADLRGGGEAAFRPVGTGLHDVTAAPEVIDARLRHAVLNHEDARPGGAPPETQPAMTRN